MAVGCLHMPGDLKIAQNDQSRSQTPIYLPPTPTPERISVYYAAKDLSASEDSNLDPFYLEQSLPDTVPWDSTVPGVSNGDESSDQYFMLPTLKSTGRTPSRSSVSKNFVRTRGSPVPYLEGSRLSSKESFTSIQSDGVPDLSPSSSFSSYYSRSAHPKEVLETTGLLCHHIKASEVDHGFSSYSKHSDRYNMLEQQSSTAAQTIMTKTRHVPKPLEIVNSSHWWKSVPNSSNHGEASKKGSSDGGRPQVEPSMISPPSLLDPVTLEPHPNHFDQVLFFPATECPSPVPSPTMRTPLSDRDTNTVSVGPPPPVSPFDPYYERSAWDSDSDSESTSRKSLSRKTNDTIKKVRSRAKLRVAKSAPKLNAAKQADTNVDQLTPARSPMHEEHYQHPAADVQRRRDKHVTSPQEPGSLRLVAPSLTSLHQTLSLEGSIRGRSNEDPSAAAAIQARYRRRQRHLAETSSLKQDGPVEFCCSECSDDSTESEKSPRRSSVFRRVWKSLRTLSCRPGAPENRAIRSL